MRCYHLHFLIRLTNFQTSRANFGSASGIPNRFIIFFVGSILLLMNSKMWKQFIGLGKKERRRIKEEDEENGDSFFLSVFCFFPS